MAREKGMGNLQQEKSGRWTMRVGITADMIAEYLACLRADLCATTYNGRVCILSEIFRTLAKKAGL